MITEMQHKTYQFIRHFRLTNGYSPTEAEIAKGIGIKSRGVAHRYVKALVEARLITTSKNKKRSIHLIEGVNLPFCSIPITGIIGNNQLYQLVHDSRALNAAEYLLGAERFAVEVKANNLSNDNICNGDYIICEPFNETTAMADDVLLIIFEQKQILLRKLIHQNDVIKLIANNNAEPTISVSPDKINIIGIYKGLLRFAI